MPKKRTLKIASGVAASFVALVATIVLLLQMNLISFEVAKLMVAALLGMYFGFGVLIAVYRLIGKLE